MSVQFQLRCEYMHCMGIHTQVVSTIETEAEALEWVEHQRNGGKRPKMSEDDPIRTCSVVRCPLKLPVPRYSYRRIES